MTNSLYSLPITGNPATNGLSGVVVSYSKTDHTIAVANGASDTDDWRKQSNAIRVSSIIVASRSPFKLAIRNSSGGFSVYSIEGGKPTKVIPSRISSVCGNPALLSEWSQSLSTGLVEVQDAEEKVDVTVNVVCDSTLDFIRG